MSAASGGRWWPSPARAGSACCCGAQAKYGASIQELSQSTGIAVEQLQLLERAFRGDGASAEQARKALGRFGRVVDEAAQGVAEYSEPFERLGINVAEFIRQGGTQEQLLYRVTDGIAGLTEQTARVGISYQIFGRAATALLPVLQRGSEALQLSLKDFERLGLVTAQDSIRLKALEQSYEDLGDVVRTGLARGVAGAADDLRELNRQLIRLIPTITGQLIPALVGVTKNLDLVAIAFAALVGFGTAGPIGAGVAVALAVIGVELVKINAAAISTRQEIGRLFELDAAGLARTIQRESERASSLVPRRGIVVDTSAPLLAAALADQRRRATEAAIFRETGPSLAPGPVPVPDDPGSVDPAALRATADRNRKLIEDIRRLRMEGVAAATTDLDALQTQARIAEEAVRTATALSRFQADDPARAALAAELSARNDYAEQVRRLQRDIAGADAERALAAQAELMTLQQQTVARAMATTQIADAARATQELSNANSELAAAQARVMELAGSIGDAFGSALERIILMGQSASDAVRALAAELLAALTRALIIQPIVAAITGGVGGFLPAFASGGYAGTGRGIVGEEGPELIDFRRPARVYNNEQLSAALAGGGGGGPALTINYNIQAGVTANEVRETLTAITPGIIDAARTVITRDMSRPSAIQRLARGAR